VTQAVASSSNVNRLSFQRGMLTNVVLARFSLKAEDPPRKAPNHNVPTEAFFKYSKSSKVKLSRGGQQGCEMLRIPHCLDGRVLRTGRALLPRNIIFLLLVLIPVRG
jgi:hypothetical protein